MDNYSQRIPRATLQELRLVQPGLVREGRIGLIYREISLPITWLLVQTAVTPNQITLSWLVVGLAGIYCLGTGAYLWTIVGGLLLQLVRILDSVDGDVARYKHAQSSLGLFLDLSSHTILKSLLFIGVGLGVYWRHQQLWIILLTICAASSLVIGEHIRFYKAYVEQKDGLKLPVPDYSRPLPLTLLMKSENIWRTAGLFGIVLLGSVSNTLYYVLIFYGIVTPFWALTVLFRMARQIRAAEVHRRSPEPAAD